MNIYGRCAAAAQSVTAGDGKDAVLVLQVRSGIRGHAVYDRASFLHP